MCNDVVSWQLGIICLCKWAEKMGINIQSTPMWKAISLIDGGENPQQWLIMAEWPETLMQISRISYTWMIWLYKSFLKPWNFYS